MYYFCHGFLLDSFALPP
uniref:Uncharacterized protein n=1 Tax=Arundo donax TaxID=35708 RepID=A0A0A9ABQ1_ARUDO